MEGRCVARKRKQYEVWRVGVELKVSGWKFRLLANSNCMFPGVGLALYVAACLLFIFSRLLLFCLSFLSPTWGCTTSTVVNVIKAPAITTVPTKIKQCLPGLQKLYSWTSSNLRLRRSVTAFRYVMFTFRICSRPLVTAECRCAIAEGDNTVWE